MCRRSLQHCAAPGTNLVRENRASECAVQSRRLTVYCGDFEGYALPQAIVRLNLTKRAFSFTTSAQRAFVRDFKVAAEDFEKEVGKADISSC